DAVSVARQKQDFLKFLDTNTPEIKPDAITRPVRHHSPDTDPLSGCQRTLNCPRPDRVSIEEVPPFLGLPEAHGNKNGPIFTLPSWRLRSWHRGYHRPTPPLPARKPLPCGQRFVYLAPAFISSFWGLPHGLSLPSSAPPRVGTLPAIFPTARSSLLLRRPATRSS